MENVNYFGLLVRALIFALVVLMLKTFIGGLAADAATRSCKTDGQIWIDLLGRHHDNYGVCTLDYRVPSAPSDYSPFQNRTGSGYRYSNNAQPAPAYMIPTGVNNVQLSHPVEDPFTSPSPVYVMND